MTYDGWVEFGGTELFNIARTAQLADSLGIDSVWVDPVSTQWIEAALGDSGYDSVISAPWYDPSYPASGEFAGIIPLSMAGLDDSTLESTPIEYVTDGGNAGKPRNKTLDIVANVAIVASTDRGAEFGKRWLDHLLRGGGTPRFCSGSDLRYFRYEGSQGGVPPKAHRRNVSATRGTSVTRKHSSGCSATWLVTFTLVAADPFEYGEEIERFVELGGSVSGPGVLSSGTEVGLLEEGCPEFDYSPVYDPLYPALIPAPSVPNFYPDGWNIEYGMEFSRHWVRVSSIEPGGLKSVPIVVFTADEDARMVRLSIWGADAVPTDQCGPLWSVILSYLPADLQFVIDGEQQAAYVWDGVGERVRRADSLVFSGNADPIDWSSLNDPGGFLVSLDIFEDPETGTQGGGTVRASLGLVPKSD